MGKIPQVLFLAGVDYANVGSLYSRALNSVGIHSRVIVREQHWLGFPDQGLVILDDKKRQRMINTADIIVFLHSVYTPGNYEGKRLFVFHGGSRYRKRPVRQNKFFNPRVERCIIQTAEMLGMGAKNEVWLLPPVDTKLIKPDYSMVNPKKLIFSHFPNKTFYKGSALINPVINQIRSDGKYKKKFGYKFDKRRVSWNDNMKRMGFCDIYIEQIGFMGNWSMTALEAAALGKIVITNFESSALYRKEYGDHAIQVANTAGKLKDIIQQLLDLDRDRIVELKKETREWVEKYHSFEAVGKRMKEEVFGIK